MQRPAATPAPQSPPSASNSTALARDFALATSTGLLPPRPSRITRSSLNLSIFLGCTSAIAVSRSPLRSLHPPLCPVAPVRKVVGSPTLACSLPAWPTSRSSYLRASCPSYQPLSTPPVLPFSVTPPPFPIRRCPRRQCDDSDGDESPFVFTLDMPASTAASRAAPLRNPSPTPGCVARLWTAAVLDPAGGVSSAMVR